MTSLEQLKQGQTAKVTGVIGGDSLSQRLMEMGLTPGALVTLIGAAPLGDPLEFEVRGYRLSIRKSEAKRIEVEPM